MSVPKNSGVVICIIGMHRSGTSMVARLLNLCGLNLGPEEKLVGPTVDNAMGHFEHTEFVEVDDALLKYFGGSWDNPPILNSGWEKDPNLRELGEKVETLIKRFSESTTWGWKDPRTTLFLPFWQLYLPGLRYVICIRNPLEVGCSLAKRDGISIPAGSQLWNQYTRAAILNTAGQQRLLTFYEDYFSNPLDEVIRVAEFCGLGRVKDLSMVEEIISGELRHQITGSEELLNETSIPLEYKFFYLALRVLRSEELGGMQSACSTKGRIPDDIGSVLTPIDKLHGRERLLQLETAVCEKEQQLNALRARMREELREKGEQISILLDRNARLQSFSDAVRATWAYRFYKSFIRPLLRHGS